jgi:hypothetical protein
MTGGVDAPMAGLDPALRERLHAVAEDGRDFWDRFDMEVRQKSFHPFVPADYDRVLQALLPLRAPGVRFLEWGSGSGVITIMADLLGFDAYGIELDAGLVETARELARKHGSNARFAAGSFLPSGYRYRPRHGDGRLGTIGDGVSGYRELGVPLDDFDIVYGYPWGGEEPMMLDLMRAYGGRDARLMMLGGNEVRIYRHGRLVGAPRAA